METIMTSARVRSLRPALPPVTVLLFRQGEFTSAVALPRHCASAYASALARALGPGHTWKLVHGSAC